MKSPHLPESTERYCVFCKQAVAAWIPFHIKASEFLRHVGSIGSNTERFFCPHCRSFDRERHLYLFLARRGIFSMIRGATVLHMSPEINLGAVIEGFEPKQLIRGDLSPVDASIEKIDLQQIPYPDCTFDLAICNHILEHVDDPKTALRELYRTLKPGGRLVCQTPYAGLLTTTFQEPLLQSPDARWYLYGQDNHLRLFGRDIDALIRSAGFTGRLVPHRELLHDIDPEMAGVNEHEPFFDFVRRKSTCPRDQG